MRWCWRMGVVISIWFQSIRCMWTKWSSIKEVPVLSTSIWNSKTWNASVWARPPLKRLCTHALHLTIQFRRLKKTVFFSFLVVLKKIQRSQNSKFTPELRAFHWLDNTKLVETFYCYRSMEMDRPTWHLVRWINKFILKSNLFNGKNVLVVIIYFYLFLHNDQ